MGHKGKAAALLLLVVPGLAALALVGVLVVFGGVLAAGVLQPWLLEMSVFTALVGLLVFLPACCCWGLAWW